MTSAYLPGQIELGEDSLNKLSTIATQLGVKNLFVIIDAFLVSPSLMQDRKIRNIVQDENLDITFFSDYKGEPTTDHVEGALNILKSRGSDCVVAMGGGSAIDIAKAVSTFAVNPDMKWGDIPAQKKLNRLPLIAIPTTAGTGSEATKVMVVKNMQTNVKMNPGHKDLIPDIAILDPVLTQSLPHHFTAYTGVDALTHAMEAYVSTNASLMTDHYALTAVEMIGKALPKVYEDGMNLGAREDMLLASCYAGIAFSNASTNLAHAGGRPLGARFNIPHGLSVALLLPFVMRFGLEAAEERYADIGLALGAKRLDSKKQMAENAVQIVEDLNEQFGIWEDGLKYINLDDLRENISNLVDDALSGNGISTNRKVPMRKDVESIFLSLVEKLKQVAIAQMA